MIAGLVLAGGASSRFGSPKHSATIDGCSLGRIALERLTKTCTSIASVGASLSAPITHEVIEDASTAERGPLAGVLAGLRWTAREGAGWLMVTPCDVPLLPPHVLTNMAAQTRNAAAPIGLLKTPDGPHPLCSVWSTSLIGQLEETLASHHPAIIQFMAERGRYAYDVGDARQLINVNTPADLQRCIELASMHWWKAAHP